MPKRNSFSIDGMVDAQTPLTDNEDGLSNNEKVINEKNRCCRCTTSIGGKCKVKWSLARVLTTSFYTLSLIAMVLTSIELRESRYKDSLHNVGWFIAGVFVCLAVPLSVFDIAQHLHNFQSTTTQKYVIRIMWMVPIYAIESWLSLRFKQFAFTLALFRDSYEAYVIYCFCYLLIALLGTENEVNEIIKAKTEHDLDHMFPFKCMFNRFEKYEFLIKVKRGVLQYVVVKIVCTIITLITSNIVINAATDETLYDENSYDFVHFHLYVVILVNCSQIWAMYCLVLFYHACMEELAPYRPFGKFVCVKAVVFFSFWQEMAIGMAVHFGIIHGTTNPFSSYTPHDVAKGSQDFLICIEMFIAAIAHHFAFHYRDFTDRNADSKIPFLKAFAEVSNPHDVVEDIRTNLPLPNPSNVKLPNVPIPKLFAGKSKTDGDDNEEESIL